MGIENCLFLSIFRDESRHPDRFRVELMLIESFDIGWLDLPNHDIHFLLRATVVTLNCSGIDVSLRLFVIPLLVSGLPNLSLAALATSKWLVEVKLRQTTICVDVRKLAVIGSNRRWMSPLLNRSKVQDSLRLANLCLGGVPPSQCVPAHDARCHLT